MQAWVRRLRRAVGLLPRGTTPARPVLVQQLATDTGLPMLLLGPDYTLKWQSPAAATVLEQTDLAEVVVQLARHLRAAAAGSAPAAPWVLSLPSPHGKPGGWVVQMADRLHDPAYGCYVAWLAPLPPAPAPATPPTGGHVAESPLVLTPDQLRGPDASVAAAGIGSWTYDPTTDNWQVSEEVVRILEQMAVPAPWKLTDLPQWADDTPEQLAAALVTAQLTQSPFSHRGRLRLAEGREKWVEIRGGPLEDPTGLTRQVGGTLQDITEETLVTEALRANEERFRAFFTNSSDVISVVNEEGRFTYLSPSAERVMGYPVEQLIGQRFFDSIHPDDLIPAIIAFELLKEGTRDALTLEYRWHMGANDWQYLESVAVNQLHIPAIRGIVINSRSVTERKLAEEALRASVRRFRGLAENSPDIIQIVNARTWKITEVNLESYLGWPSDKIRDSAFVFGLVHPEDLPRYTAARKWLFKQPPGTLCAIEFRAKNVQGQWEWLRMRERVLSWDTDGRALEILGTYTVITQQRQVEEALRRSEQRLQQLVRYASDALILMDTEGRNTYISPALERILGFTPDDRLGQTGFEFIHPEDLPRVLSEFSDLVSRPGYYHTFNYRGLHQQGHWVDLEAAGINLLHEPAVEAVVLYIRDISGRKESERQLLGSLKEKEVLLQEIYHRVKNNLQVVISLIDFESDRTQQAQLLSVLQESRNRIYAIALVHEKLYRTQDLNQLDFSDYLYALTTYILEAYEVERRRLPIELEFSVPPVAVDLDTAMRCGLVVNELLSNSLKYAFPAGQPGKVIVRVTAVGGKLETLEVGDTGVGIPDFDPQKSDTLGLRLVRLIGQQLQTTLTVESTEGLVYRFRFRPPAGSTEP